MVMHGGGGWGLGGGGGGGEGGGVSSLFINSKVYSLTSQSL